MHHVHRKEQHKSVTHGVIPRLPCTIIAEAAEKQGQMVGNKRGRLLLEDIVARPPGESAGPGALASQRQLTSDSNTPGGSLVVGMSSGCSSPPVEKRQTMTSDNSNTPGRSVIVDVTGDSSPPDVVVSPHLLLSTRADGDLNKVNHLMLCMNC
jgi:hypothetical protein